MTTLEQATATLNAHGMTLKKTATGYRVAFEGARGFEAERCAHYTTDIDDAIAVGIQMRGQQDRIDAANAKHRAKKN